MNFKMFSTCSSFSTWCCLGSFIASEIYSESIIESLWFFLFEVAMQGFKISGSIIRLKFLLIRILSINLFFTILVKSFSRYSISWKQRDSRSNDPPFGIKKARSIKGWRCYESQTSILGFLFLAFLITSCFM